MMNIPTHKDNIVKGYYYMPIIFSRGVKGEFDGIFDASLFMILIKTTL